MLKDKNGKEFKTCSVAKDDYPELETRIVDYILSSGRIIKGLVVGCNRSVGLTIVNVEDKNHYLACYRGPVVSDSTNCDNYLCTYDDIFDLYVEMIKAGEVYAERAIKLKYNYSVAGICTGNCAYRQ